MSSLWPFPSTPAMPTISPRWTVKETSSTTVRPSLSTTLSPSATSATSSVTVESRVSGVGSSLPTMSSASWRAVTEATSSISATVLPARITVMASATPSTSSSLCEMKTTVAPWPVSSRRDANSSSTSCGTRTAVGSSRMMMRAPRYSTFRISTRCRSPTPNSAVSSSGST